ncbi:MAG: tetratricopeptide repeat protein [Chitinophagales bacterium]
MAKDKGIDLDDEVLLEESHDSIEHFIENNQNIILGVLGVIILAIAIFVGYKRFIVAPKEAEAKSVVFYAQNWFAADSFKLALEGDGANYGFYDIIDEYKVTKIGKMARYYAGISELQLGNYDAAITQLSKFKTSDDNVQAVAYAAIGDANAQLGNMDKAITQYKKAAETATLKSVSAAYFFRAGKAYEVNEDYKGAKEMYKKIVSLYPDANQFNLSQADQDLAKKATKNLARVEALAE